MRLLIWLLKQSIQLFPRPLRNWLLAKVPLASFYRKLLYSFYFDSYNFDSRTKALQYERWIKAGCDQDPSENTGLLLVDWLVVILVREESALPLKRSVRSLLDVKGRVPSVFLYCDDQFKSNVELTLKEFVCLPNIYVISHAGISSISAELSGRSKAYVSFLSPGDMVAGNILIEFSQAISNNPDSILYYSDHDYLDSEQKRFDPQFKPAWNLDLFLTTFYLDRAVFISLKLDDVKRIVKGAFESDLVCAKELLDLLCNDVGRFTLPNISKVLFHLTDKSKRDISSLGTWGECVKQYSGNNIMASKLDVERHFYSFEWALPPSPPLVSIVIPTKNCWKLVEKCIHSIFELSGYDNVEILLVDNQSDEKASLDYFDKLRLHPKVHVLKYDKPFNYSAINNWAVSQVSGEIIALVNNDIEAISPGWLREMVAHALRPMVGAVGAKLLYTNNSVQHAGVIIGLGGVAGHAHKFFPRDHNGYMKRLRAVHNVSAVTAACLVVRKFVYEEVGGLNEKDLTVAFNDVDFCLRVQEAGYRNVFTPHAVLYHHESVSRGLDQAGEKLKRFQAEIQFMKQRWKTDVDPDPAYNPNLTLSREDFSLRFEDEC